MKRLFSLFFICFFISNIYGQKTEYNTQKGIRYRLENDVNRNDSMCMLNIYYPSNKKDFATVIWFHGGGLTGGRLEIPKELQNNDMAIVGVDYRLLPNVTVKDCIEDAAASAAWVVKNIEKYGGSKNKIFVAGHSAGGYLTSMIGLDKSWLSPYGIDPDKDFAALIPYSGQVITHFSRRKEMGMEEKQPLVDELAPLYFVRKDAAPLLVLSGDREKELLGRYEENAYFVRMMKIAGHRDITFYEFDGFDHGNMVQPGHYVALRFIKQKCKEINKK